MLIQIPDICPISMRPGITEVFYLPRIGVNSSNTYIVNESGKLIGAITPATGFSILSIPLQLDKNSYNTQSEPTEQGPSYPTSIKGYFPGWNEAVIAEMNKMTRLTFLVWCKAPGDDKNMIIGDTYNGATFRFSYESGEAPGDPAGINIEFVWNTGRGIIFNKPA